MKPLPDQLTAARRELALRQRCYPKWLADGRAGWTADKVRHEIECMESIVATLERCVELDKLGQEFRLDWPEGKATKLPLLLLCLSLFALTGCVRCLPRPCPEPATYSYDNPGGRYP